MKRPDRKIQNRLLEIIHGIANCRIRESELKKELYDTGRWTGDESKEQRKIRAELEQEWKRVTETFGTSHYYDIQSAGAWRYDWFFDVAHVLFDTDLLEAERTRENWWRKDTRVQMI